MISERELTQAQKHMAQKSGVSLDPEMVAVVQYEEDTQRTVVLLNGQEVEDGGEVDYKGKKFPVEVEVLTIGTVPDEVDHETIVGYESVEAFSRKHKTKVTTSVPIYGTRPGRTVYSAHVTLSVGGVAIPLAAEGSHVVCTAATYRRWSGTVPNTVWGFAAAPVGKQTGPDD